MNPAQPVPPVLPVHSNLRYFEARNVELTIAALCLKANVKVSEQERVAIQGASGTGKSSFLRYFAGIQNELGSQSRVESEGELWLSGVRIDQLSPENRDIGLVFQDGALFPALSVGENVSFGLKVRHVSKIERLKQAEEWLKKVGLDGFSGRSVSDLSGGERQRVALARTLILRPKLLLLDEPFSALDAELKVGLRELIRQLHEEFPVPLIFVSHDLTDVENLATRCLRFHETTDLKSQRIVRELVESN